jgi:putative ABC transport system permease protein
MLRATWRGLLSRKLRLLLASISVLLGISFTSGAYVLTDSIGKVFDNLFATINDGTAVTVQGVSAFGTSAFEGNDREPVPQSVLDKVLTVDGVASANGDIGQEATLVLPSGKAMKSAGPPILGVSFHKDSPMETLTIVRGEAPVGLGQVMLDGHTMTKEKLALGDTIGVIGNGTQQQAKIIGISRFGSTNSLAGATLMAFDPASAQTLFGTPGTWDQVSISAKPGIDDKTLRDRVAQALDTKKYEVLTSQQSSAQQADQIKQGIGFFNTVLQWFARIALFVGAFLIFNTFAMLVAQRTRELALMRALGASRSQVMRSVLVEAIAVGLFGAIGGLLLGILLASGFRSIMNAIGLEIPKGETVVELRTVLVCLISGVLVTVVAAVVPARRASRVSPVQALRESSPAESQSLARRTSVGGLITAIGITLFVAGLAQGKLPVFGLGAFVSFIGIAVISPVFAKPVVGTLALPFAQWGVSGRLGRGNAIRNPRRTSTTAAALMIGLALVAAVSTLGSSAKKSTEAVVATSLGADYVLHTDQFLPFSPAVATALQGRPALDSVVAFTTAQARIAKAGGKGDTTGLQGVDPRALQKVLKLKVLSGDLDGLRDDQVAVSKNDAKSLKAKVGDAVDITWAKTGKQAMTVGAIYDINQFAGGYLVTDKEFASHVTDRKVIVVAVKAAASASPSQSRAAVEEGLKPFPNVEVEDQAEFVKMQGDQIDGLLTFLTALLLFAVVIAILGIVNTLALSVVERTREIGLLRAVGLQRTQLKRMIRVESTVIALFGALLGVLVGLGIGYGFVNALKDEGLNEFAVPWARIVIVFFGAALGGVIAAAIPARRGAKLKILTAISTD